ncbi:MAG: adenosine deaminase [Ignavibacteria bacterium]|nr:MAG: adenosine deaminase [Ignavibacteria bacterium]KAF0161753.1 MAG: adenosine deaminase [Ignavibacteria bacterium]
MHINKSFEEFIKGIPKAELHLHIEGTLEPKLMLELAKRNKVKLKYDSVDELHKAYSFKNLQEFLDIYYAGATVLITEQDFYDMTWAYLAKAHLQNVIHAEIFFDPQTHTNRGISFDTVINGIHKALEDAKTKFGLTAKLIPCLLRDLDVESAVQTLNQVCSYKNWIAAIGLDSAEVGNPPSKFKEVFNTARQNGFLTVAHAGEEGPAEYVWEAINLLKVSRIDHGNNSLDDEKLVDYLSEQKIPLTFCPLSNLKLKVVTDLKKHPLKTMLEKGLMVTINSDDPAYFGGYVNENYLSIAESIGLLHDEVCVLAKNSFNASFLTEQEKQFYINKVEEYNKNFNE